MCVDVLSFALLEVFLNQFMSYKGELLEMAGPGHAACWGYPCWGYFKNGAFSTLQGAASNTFLFFLSLYHLSLSAPGREPDGSMASAAR